MGWDLLLLGLMSFLYGVLTGRYWMRHQLQRKLDLMTWKFETAHLAAQTYRDECEELAQRVKEERG